MIIIISEDTFIRELDGSDAGHMLAMVIHFEDIMNRKICLTVTVSS